MPPVVQKAMSRVGDIATLPEVTVKIIQIVEDPRSSARDLHEVIRTDPALSTRLLKVVNSAFYGLPGQVATVDRAIVLLGLSTVKNIAIAASISRLFTGDRISESFTARDIWRHSIGVAVCARELYKRGYAEQPDADELFLAGLIHDLGLLIERQAFPEELATAIDQCVSQGGSFLAVEEEVIGATHEMFGQALAAKWKFPPRLRTALGYHHTIENLSPEHRTMPLVVHVADTIVAHERIGFPLTALHQQLTPELLASIRITEDAWAELKEELLEKVTMAETAWSS
jgi:HD-like signal output (HDOD) protein